MANYYLPGYQPPEGINDKATVMRMQATLGVKQDGIWGPKTQSAYESRTKTEAAAQSDPFSQYYNEVLKRISVDEIKYDMPDKQTLTSEIGGFLRPEAERAISARRQSGSRSLAEIDADAAARGMGSSTFVTSVKARELENVEKDIGDIEVGYFSALEQRVFDAMLTAADKKLQADTANSQMKASAQSAAYKEAMSWYNAMLAAASKGSGGGRSKKSSAMTPAQYAALIAGLSGTEKELLKGSGDAYWKTTREDIVANMGQDWFNSKLAGNEKKGTTAEQLREIAENDKMKDVLRGR